MYLRSRSIVTRRRLDLGSGSIVVVGGRSTVASSATFASSEPLETVDDICLDGGDGLGELVQGVGLLCQDVGASSQQTRLGVKKT